MNFGGITKTFAICHRPERRARLDALLSDFVAVNDPSISSSEAHKKILTDIASGPDGLFLIVEDDVLFRDDAPEQWERIRAGLDTSWDIIYFGCDTTRAGARQGTIGGVQRIEGVLHSHAYVVSKASAARLLQSASGSAPIDWLWANDSTLKKFVTVPILALQTDKTHATDERSDFLRHSTELQRMDGFTLDTPLPIFGDALIQNGTGNHAEMLRLTMRGHSMLCALQSFDYRATFEHFLDTPHPNWAKLPLIRRTLATAPEDALIIYADCDVFFRPIAQLSTILPAPFEMGMTKKCGEKSSLYRDDGVYNAGVIAMRNTIRVRSFWATVEAMGPIPGIEWHDQETICEVLNSAKDNLNFLELDRVWNDYRKPPGQSSFVWAWHGIGDEAARRRLEAVVND